MTIHGGGGAVSAPSSLNASTTTSNFWLSLDPVQLGCSILAKCAIYVLLHLHVVTTLSDNQRCIPPVEFICAWSILPSQVVVSVKFDPLRYVRMPLVRSDLLSNWLGVKDLTGGTCQQFYQGI
jgi:hypothetical protein